MEINDYFWLDIEFPDVDFNMYYSESDDVSNIHYSRLYIHENEIELRIYYDDKTHFGEKVSMWSQRVGWRKFGSFLKVSNVGKNERLRNIDFSESKLSSIHNSTSYYEGKVKFVILKLNTVKFYWNPVKEKVNTAEFYLMDVGFRVVEPFYSVLFGFDGKFDIKRMRGMNNFYSLGKSKFRPEFNTYSKDSKSNRIAEIVKEPKIQFKYTKPVTENEAIFYGNIVCNLSSFYYHVKIDYSLRRIHLPEHTITIKKVQENNFHETRGALWGLNNYWDFHKFLQSNWQRATLKNFKLLSKAIELFNQALLVDSNSEFLLRYNIIEICNNIKQEGEKFNFLPKGSAKKRIFNKALELLLESIDENERDQFKNKWISLSGKLEYKPMTSPLNKFLLSQNLNVDEFPISVSKLKELRDKITHGSIEKIDSELLRKSNQLLYRINGILILNLMGIKEWKLITVLT